MSIIYEPKGRALEYSFLALNHYIGCSHECDYCYVPDMKLFANRDFTQPEVRPNVIERLKKEAPRHAWTNKRVLLCFTCDPYQPLDDEKKVTRSVIKILKENNIPFQVLTKGGTRAVRDFDLYTASDAFATTLTFIEDVSSIEIEPNAALPESRIQAIKIAHKRGIETWVSLEPILYVWQSLEIIKITHEFVDLYKIGKLNHKKSNINWRQFGIWAIELCKKYQKRYYIKDDLAAYLEGIKYTNTDTRLIDV